MSLASATTAALAVPRIWAALVEAGLAGRVLETAGGARSGRELEALVIPKDLQRLKQRLSQEYADLVA